MSKYRRGCLSELNSPPTLELVVIANVPLRWLCGVDNDQSYSVVGETRDLDIEILVIVNALDSPCAVSVRVPTKVPLR